MRFEILLRFVVGTQQLSPVVVVVVDLVVVVVVVAVGARLHERNW